MPFDKLYVKIKCVACQGTKSFGNYYDPKAPHKWRRCPYCDPDGCETIEASIASIKRYIELLPEEEKKKFLILLKKQ